jgi:Fe2+ transport system protein FeoA
LTLVLVLALSLSLLYLLALLLLAPARDAVLDGPAPLLWLNSSLVMMVKSSSISSTPSISSTSMTMAMGRSGEVVAEASAHPDWLPSGRGLSSRFKSMGMVSGLSTTMIWSATGEEAKLG